MDKYDCVILYNNIEDFPSYNEDYASEANVRDEVFAVEDALHELGFNPYVFAIDRIDKEIISTLLKISPKFVFNLCEALYGKSEMEMCVAALLELLSLPYTGSTPLALGLALNKNKTKHLLLGNSIPTPNHWILEEGSNYDLNQIKFPVIVKPVHEDASIGIGSDSVVENLSALKRQVRLIHQRYRQTALVEQYVDGRELNVSILGDEDPVVLPISEIDFSGLPSNEFKIVSYKAKWDPDSPLYQNTVPICPAKLASKVASQVKELALKAFKVMGCRDYARVDMRLDEKNNPYVIEVNPNPDISPSAGLARSALAAGLSYTDLIAKIVEFTLARSIKEAKVAYASR